MKHSRLIQKFSKWQKSSDNVMKKEGLFNQIELFQYLEEENDLNIDEFIQELVKSNKNYYTRLLRKGMKDEYFQNDW